MKGRNNQSGGKEYLETDGMSMYYLAVIFSRTLQCLEDGIRMRESEGSTYFPPALAVMTSSATFFGTLA